MCDDEHDELHGAHDEPGQHHLWSPGPVVPREALPSPIDGSHLNLPSRRAVMAGVVAGATTLALPPSRAVAAARVSNLVGQRWYRAAMHLHGSFSEGNGSWAQHFSQAALNGFDVLVPTEHDWRVLLRHYGGSFHFTGWTETTPSGFWQLQPQVSTSNLSSTSSGSLVPTAPPTDTTSGAGSLHLAVSASNSAVARLVYQLNVLASNKDINGTVLGRQLHLAVLLNSLTSARSSPLVQLTLAHDPVHGLKTLNYRLRGDITAAGPPMVVGGNATLDYPIQRGAWSDFAPDVLADIHRCWPDVVAADNSINSIRIGGAGSKTLPLDCLLADLHLDPDPAYDGAASLDAVIAAVAASYPQLLVPVGLEHSVDHHLGQIGGQRFFYPYPETGAGTHSQYGDAVAFDQVAKIVDHGGVAGYNHPFGVGTTVPTGAARAAALTATIGAVLATGAYRADTLEVGYAKRGMDLAGHLELLDSTAANLLFITGVGVSDDHTGLSWATQPNRFTTLPWMAQLDEPSLQAALRGGRVSVGLLGSFDGSLDLSINNLARMGQALVAPASASDTLVVECYNPPAGSSLRVVTGPVDLRGTSFTRSATLTTIPATALSAGVVAIPLPITGPAYYRVEVLDKRGTPSPSRTRSGG